MKASDQNRLATWETELSNFECIYLHRILQDVDKLEITVTVPQPDIRDETFQIVWDRVSAWRVTDESYWDPWSNDPSEKIGVTNEVENSSWLEELRQCNANLIDFHEPGTKHYVILTRDRVVEVLSVKEPYIAKCIGRKNLDCQ